MTIIDNLGMSALPLRFLTPLRLGYGIRQPARFPSEETRSASSFALPSLQSRNHARSVVHGLPHPHPSPLSPKKPGALEEHFGKAKPSRSLLHSQVILHIDGDTSRIDLCQPFI